MRNILIVALCCVTLLAVAGDFLFLHAQPVHAQAVQVYITKYTTSQSVFPLGGTIVGFSCTANGECFIASR